MKIRRSFIVAAVALVLTLLASHLRSTPYNNYVLFANALLHGRLWIDWPGPYIDAVLWNGHRYIVNDPLPGLLMLPFVAIWGVAANQTFLAVILCAIAVGAAWELCERLDCEPGVAVWLCEGHASSEFQRRRSGRDFVLTLSRLWQANGCLTAARGPLTDNPKAAAKSLPLEASPQLCSVALPGRPLLVKPLQM